MTRNYLLFGGSGFVGDHLANYINTKALGAPLVFDIVSPIQGDRTHEEIDVRQSIETNYKPTETDVLFNLAAVHRTPGHPSNEYYETNILGAENVCNYARKHNINTIVFTSSIATYGTYEEQKSEETVPKPDIPYGISKLTAEYIHKLWQNEDPESRRLIIVRPGVVFGKYERGNFTRLINSISKKRFFYPGRTDTIKACIYVKDLVETMIHMIDQEGFGAYSYNITYDPAPSISEICGIISDKGGLSRPKIKLPAFLLILVSKVLYTLTKKKGIHPDRVKKLMISNNINGKKLKNNYTLFYGLKEGISDWMKDTNFDENKNIY